MSTLSLTTTFQVIQCANCHVPFGMADTFAADRRRDHKTFYCPSGHSQYFPGESDLEVAERKRKEAQRAAEYARSAAQAARDQAAAAERSTRAYKGHLTRMRNSIARGVCPVAGCRRHFDSVQAHIETQHPEWASANVEALRA